MVVEFVRQFSLSTKFLSESVEPTGLLLYGLQGCGKRQILEVLSDTDALSNEDKVTNHVYLTASFYSLQEWHQSLYFLTLSVDDYTILKSDISSSSFRKYIGTKLGDIPRSCSGVVLLLPDLDTWSTFIQNPDSTHSDDPQDFELLNRTTSLHSFLFNSLKLASATTPVCAIATSTESAEILKHRDLRNLFFRKVLVSLPSGDQRCCLLKEEMRIYLPQRDAEIKASPNSEDANRLQKFAASLHGYTVA